MTKARQIVMEEECEDETLDEYQEQGDDLVQVKDSVRRIQVRLSPYLDAFSGHQHVRPTIASGATGNTMAASVAQRLKAVIKKSGKSAHQADRTSPLSVVGETNLVTRDHHKFIFEVLVVESFMVHGAK
jgi:hypothetical protein